MGGYLERCKPWRNNQKVTGQELHPELEEKKIEINRNPEILI
jgi:hypothetical protein